MATGNKGITLAFVTFAGVAILSALFSNSVDAVSNWNVVGDSSGQTPPQLLRSAAASDGADVPSGRGILRMPASQSSSGNEDVPTAEDCEPPAEPCDPNSENNDDNNPDDDFLGEDIGPKTVFIIDVSRSMGFCDVGGGEDWDGNIVACMSRLMLVKSELIRLLRNLDDTYWIDIIWLAGGTGAGNTQLPNTDTWQGELVRCTDDVRTLAIGDVIAQDVWLGTPTWWALKQACLFYEHDLTNLFLLTDGAPYPYGSGEWGSSPQSAAILSEFPTWFAEKRANGCDLAGIHVGQNPNAGTFMQEWCSQNNASYTHR